MATNETVPYSEQIDFLSAVRALIADEAHWCKGTLAIDAQCKGVDAKDDNAAAWCIMGAFVRVDVDRGLVEVWQDTLSCSPVYAQSWYALSSTYDPVVVNDLDGHEAVLALIDDTIVRLKIRSGLAEIDTTIDRLEKNKNVGE